MSQLRAATPSVAVRDQLATLLKSQFAIEKLSYRPPPDSRFRSFSSPNISVLDVQGSPIALRKAASHSTDVHLLRLQRGSVELSHAYGSFTLQAGAFVAYSGAHPIELRHEHNVDLVAVFLPVRAVERWLPDWQIAEFVVIHRQAEGRLSFDIARDLLGCGDQLQDSGSAELVGETVARLMARSLSLSSLATATAPEELAEAHRRRVRAYCRRNLGSAALCVDSVARGTQLSRASLHRLFRTEPHTLMQWVQIERLEACRRLLEQPGPARHSLTEIALSQGFKSPAHFSTAFRSRYGVAPRDYRVTSRTEPSRHVGPA